MKTFEEYFRSDRKFEDNPGKDQEIMWDWEETLVWEYHPGGALVPQ